MYALVLCTAVVLWGPAVVADIEALPMAGQTAQQAQATPVPTEPVVAPVAQASSPPCPCICQPAYSQSLYPVGNVAPPSWYHEDQNDDEWPADHGG